MPLLNGMLSTGRLAEFVDEVITIHNEEYREKTLWDHWLHRVFDKSFAEFMEMVNGEQHAEAPTQGEVKNIVSGSMNILNGFVPKE